MAYSGNVFTTNQPGKAVWTLIALSFNAFRLPLWILLSIPRFLRQNPKWSFAQSVRVRIVRAFLYNSSIVQIKTPLSLKPGAEGDRFVVIQPAKKSLYTGVVDKDPEIKPLPVGATWYPAALKPSEKDTAQVVLHFHGGAYVIGDGREKDTGFLSRTLLANTTATHVLCLQYRLSSNSGGRFPAALQDAISSLSYLVDTLKIPASSITVSGDSAGGNLVLGLLRYIADNPTIGLPSPVCAWLWSPWVSPKNAYEGQAFDVSPNYKTDYLTGGFGTWGVQTFAPNFKTGVTIADPAITFMDQPFKTKTPLYISTGECEVLFHDDVKLAEQLRSAGNTVQLQVEDNAVHDIILTGKLVGFEKEAALAARRAGTFLAGVRRT